MTFQNEDVIDLRHTPHFLITVNPSAEGQWKSAKVEIIRQAPDDFGYWVCAAEYFLHKACQLSPAGYERAMELICRGAMTWRDKESQP